MNTKLICALGALAMCAAMILPAHATELLTNGNFETGDFTGWTTNVQGSSNGNLFVNGNGALSPQSAQLTQTNPSGGNFVALTDQSGPGSYSLTQSFTLSSATRVMVNFDMFANANAPFALTDPHHDFTVSPNENAEVNILVAGANPFTISPADIVATLYGPAIDSGSPPNPWTHYSSDLGMLAAGTYMIRFVETDNQSFFNMGVDNVSVATGVPEPITVALFGAGLAGVGAMRRRKARG